MVDDLQQIFTETDAGDEADTSDAAMTDPEVGGDVSDLPDDVKGSKVEDTEAVQ